MNLSSTVEKDKRCGQNIGNLGHFGGTVSAVFRCGYSSYFRDSGRKHSQRRDIGCGQVQRLRCSTEREIVADGRDVRRIAKPTGLYVQAIWKAQIPTEGGIVVS